METEIVASRGVLRDHSWNYERVLIQTNSVEVVKAIQNLFLSSSNSVLTMWIHLLLKKVGQWLL
ncbi:hypothetical protein Golax_002940 [Gossypium laxum]|uniref:RNase H type-1 domain-containing protein n=1 Tax=Gossypium laxum TaxID=34288 RepID=A0A7J9AEF4_9ROSI|nr:hypothetical protein [Gossypium laxum]